MSDKTPEGDGHSASHFDGGKPECFCILARQGGGCGVCGGESQRAYYDLDHCHETGTVRGLLCGRCNKGLGLLGDNEEAVMRALKYLRSHSKASINE
jgi:hypothetical protein